jgi:hypothetical protein
MAAAAKKQAACSGAGRSDSAAITFVVFEDNGGS